MSLFRTCEQGVTEQFLTMAVDRLSFLTDPSPDFRGLYHSSLQNDFILRSPGTIFSNLHFVPEKITNFTVTQVKIIIFAQQLMSNFLCLFSCNF